MAKGDALREFHCYLLDEHGHIVLREDITAVDLEEAVKLGFQALQRHRTRGPHPAVGIEVWSGEQRLFSGKPL